MKRLFLRYFSLFMCFLLLSITSVNIIHAAAFNKKEAKKKITVTYKKLPDGILAIYKNKNKYPVKLTGTMRFQDADKKDVQVLKEQNFCLEKGASCAMFFSTPYDSDGHYINYSNYKGSFTVAETKYKGYCQKINISADMQVVRSNFSAINTGKKTLSTIHVSIIFYDAEDRILGYRGKYLNCYKKDSMDLFTIDYPAGWGTPANVKIYVDCAY